MNTTIPEAQPASRNQALPGTAAVVLALVAFIALFVFYDQAYVGFADARFPNVGTSAWLATLWGIVSRAHLLVFIIPLVLWRPRWFGFQIGQIGKYWKMLLIMLAANCGIIAAYLWLTSSSTPYSGNQWLVTEMITVPVVEEIFWRGLVFTLLASVLKRFHPEKTSTTLAVWLSGVAFGLLHANNLFAGVPLAFVAVQVFNAVVWGVVYGYARAKTGSIYPPILLHAAMNLVVILF